MFVFFLRNHLFTNNETKEIILNESEIMLAIGLLNII